MVFCPPKNDGCIVKDANFVILGPSCLLIQPIGAYRTPHAGRAVVKWTEGSIGCTATLQANPRSGHSRPAPAEKAGFDLDRPSIRFRQL